MPNTKLVVIIVLYENIVSDLVYIVVWRFDADDSGLATIRGNKLGNGLFAGFSRNHKLILYPSRIGNVIVSVFYCRVFDELPCRRNVKYIELLSIIALLLADFFEELQRLRCWLDVLEIELLTADRLYLIYLLE